MGSQKLLFTGSIYISGVVKLGDNNSSGSRFQLYGAKSSIFGIVIENI